MSGMRTVLALAPYCDGLDVGEAWCAHQWVSHLASHAQVTLLTLRRSGRVPTSQQLPNVEVVEWDERLSSRRFSRLSSMLKPGYLGFYTEARRWIDRALAAGRHFDIAHQFTPIALRYPTPLAEFPIPYVIGPLGRQPRHTRRVSPASVAVPPGIPGCADSIIGGCAGILRCDAATPVPPRCWGVAPYVGELLKHATPERFEVISELGIEALAPSRNRIAHDGCLKLLHVGRAVRTQGPARCRACTGKTCPMMSTFIWTWRDRAKSLLFAEVKRRGLGVADRITFHGQISREAVESLYANADAFLFPSFREPSGSVVFEAMRHGLPVITIDRGGPGFVVDQSCGVRVPAVDPDQLAVDLSLAITRLARDPELQSRLAIGARERISNIGLWDNKIRWLLDFYSQLLETARQPDLKEVI